MTSDAGPFDSEREAWESPAVRAVYDAPAGDRAALTMNMLLAACTAAGVTPGAYDLRILNYLARLEPATCAVIAGLIRRAAG